MSISESAPESESTLVGSVELVDGGGIDVQLGKGEVLYVLGPNGSGKSSLLFKWSERNQNVIHVTGNREVVFAILIDFIFTSTSDQC